jgi:hypothetical protein
MSLSSHLALFLLAVQIIFKSMYIFLHIKIGSDIINGTLNEFIKALK